MHAPNVQVELTPRERDTIIYGLEILLAAYNCGDNPNEDSEDVDLLERGEISDLIAGLKNGMQAAVPAC